MLGVAPDKNTLEKKRQEGGSPPGDAVFLFTYGNNPKVLPLNVLFNEGGDPSVAL